MLGGRVATHRIWIVDDVALELEATKLAFDKLFHVEVFTDGAAVLERAIHGPELPDVLILDWHMRGISGLDVLRFLRSHERTLGLPILVFTATGDQTDLIEALAAGADDYVGKGSSVAELRARVGTLLRAKGLRDRAERAEQELAVLLERERELRADAEAANQAKDQFLATVSHELRTPLNAILGWARLLGMGVVDSTRITTAAAVIERNARAQAQLVDDLLDVSRIVSGKLRLELARVDLREAVEQAIETIRPAAVARGTTLTGDLAPDCFIRGDAARLQQIAWNLLSNAVKFTAPGGHVTVRLAPRGDEVVLRVEDDGPGIPPGVLPFVFDRFRQADSATTRSHAGLGLGLAIVRQLVALHDGRVTAGARQPPPGAAFEVVFPRVRDANSRPKGSSSAPRAGALGGLRLLVVEDDPDSRAVLQAILEAYGARVVGVASAAEALGALTHGVPDVLLSDIAMPDQDGYSLLRQVRRGPWADVPAIALTALARDEDRLDARTAGFQAHVAKPIETEELVRTILAVCGAHAGPSRPEAPAGRTA